MVGLKSPPSYGSVKLFLLQLFFESIDLDVEVELFVPLKALHLSVEAMLDLFEEGVETLAGPGVHCAAGHFGVLGGDPCHSVDVDDKKFAGVTKAGGFLFDQGEDRLRFVECPFDRPVKREIVNLAVVAADLGQGVAGFVEAAQEKFRIHSLQIGELVPAGVRAVVEEDAGTSDQSDEERESDRSVTDQSPQEEDRRGGRERPDAFPGNGGGFGEFPLFVIQSLADPPAHRKRGKTEDPEGGELEEKKPRMPGEKRPHGRNQQGQHHHVEQQRSGASVQFASEALDGGHREPQKLTTIAQPRA